MIKRLPANLDEPERYQDADHSRTYHSVVGALAWPFKERPGFLVVMARDLDPDAGGLYHLWLLDEHESSDIGALIRSAVGMRQKYQAKTWMGNVTNKPAMYLLGELMRGKDYRDRLYLDMAPHAADAQGLSFYLPLIKECIGGKKLLHLGDSLLPGYLSQVKSEDLSRNPEDLPAIASLGYALAELYGYQAIVVDNTVDYSKMDAAWML